MRGASDARSRGGRLTDAEELIAQAFALGGRALPDVAIPVYRLQRYALCDFQGRLEEVEPAIRDLVAEYPARPVFRCALAHLHARLGHATEAKRALDDLAQDDFSGLPFDQEWLFGMSLLAETSALLGDSASAAVLYRLLVPWAAFNAADHPEGIRGSISRYLGLLATMTQSWPRAELHFEDALAGTSGWARAPGSPTPSTTTRGCCTPVTVEAISSAPKHCSTPRKRPTESSAWRAPR